MPLNSKLQPIFTRVKYKVKDYCPNCHFPLPYKAKFCARCGQKRASGMISLGNLFKQVWFRVLHLESRSLRFMLLLFIPGYVTSEFFSGRQKRYPQPIRFFFIFSFFFCYFSTSTELTSLLSFLALMTSRVIHLRWLFFSIMVDSFWVVITA